MIAFFAVCFFVLVAYLIYKNNKVRANNTAAAVLALVAKHSAAAEAARLEKK